MANSKGGIRLLKSIKAISPVISILLTIIVAVVAGLILYAWSAGYLGTQTAKAGTEIKIESVAFTRNDTKCATCHSPNRGATDGTNPSTVISNTTKKCGNCHIGGTGDAYASAPGEYYLRNSTVGNTYGMYSGYSGFNNTGWSAVTRVAEHKINWPAGSKSPSGTVTCTSKAGCHANIHDEVEDCYDCHAYVKWKYSVNTKNQSIPGHKKMIHTTNKNCTSCHGMAHGSSAVTLVVRNTGTEDVNLGDLYVNGVKYSYSLVSGDANNDGKLNVKEAWSLRALGLAWQPKSVVSEYKFEISTTTGVVSSRTVEPPSTTTYVP